MNEAMNRALDFLRDKYGIPEGKIVDGPEFRQIRLHSGSTVNLLPWRTERRFTELKKIIDGSTIQDVSTFRFARFEPQGNLRKMIAEELDLAEFLSGSRIVRIFASGNADAACNVIFRLENAMSGCVECGTRLPKGSVRMDRHEIIARRGVASDRVVDTQVPQSSIYTWTAEGNRTYTDTDAELFGLPEHEIRIVRAAFAVLSAPETTEDWNGSADRSLLMADAALDSAKNGETVKFEGAK